MSSNENSDPAQIAHRVRMANGQTADGFVVEKYDGTNVFSVDPDGNATISGTSYASPEKIHDVRCVGGYGFASLAAALTFIFALVLWGIDKL